MRKKNLRNLRIDISVGIGHNLCLPISVLFQVQSAHHMLQSHLETSFQN